ncbi:hypothetical protein [Natrinema hispanicum]|uniref:Dolichyl-phosphate-mannose-protein mannosyltransferase n=1 Tax=Natrinema hispanicum TaxID=392421 RepID=A0A1G6UHK1_9EURY|nr:hypothetical protein [Natrinema hispanicum]SDD40196.1 hypothetical protein SAMN05192552_102133 [Natrinema hispanicum]SET97060.1 hypothetical protein SAMN04488694_12137 [Natrinema hispanicum]
MPQARSRSTLGESGLLAIGFLALSGAVFAAHSTPATGYELSLYTNTPLAFWILSGCALFVSLLVSFGATTDWYRQLGLGLGGGSLVAFVGLPILRGYRFYGAGDALTHLGWIRGIQSGSFSPIELEYPAFHTVTTILSVIFEIDLAHAALFVIVTLSSLFFLFVTLSVSVGLESPYSTVIGAFSAFLFLPITNLSTYLVPHAMSQAILFFSVTLYLLLKYVGGGAVHPLLSAIGVLFAITSITLVFYHPQLVAHLLVVFLGICVLQYLYRRYRTDHPIVDHRPIYGQTIVLLAAFLAWTTQHDFLLGSVEYAVSGALAYFIGGGSASDSIGSQSTSLAELGASATELFLKLFSPSLVFIGLTGLLMLWTIWENDGTMMRKTNGFVPYFIISLAGLTGVFALYFLGSYGNMYFRVLGLMLVLITITGSIAIVYGLTTFAREHLPAGVHGIVIVGLGFLLLISLVAVFPSPYIYSASPHVTDMSMSGHQTAFDNRDENVTFVGIRAGPNRYADAIRGELTRNQQYDGITSEEIDNGLSRQYIDDRYLIVTQADKGRELRAYQELRYSRRQLNSVGGQYGVNRVESNGEFELYYIYGMDE